MRVTIDGFGGLHDVPGIACAGLPLGANQGGLGLVWAEGSATVGCAVYTRNDIKGAPVLLCQEHDRAGPSKRAVVINSGSANTFTGVQGLRDARASAKAAARALGLEVRQIYVGSTGAIGVPLPLDAIIAGIDELVARRATGESASRAFAQAIMTTDTRPKQASVRYVDDEGTAITIAAAVKGAGMIMPQLATMLCVVATDATIAHGPLSAALGTAVEATFHHATVDGDTSTNDTVFALANGSARNAPIDAPNGAGFRLFVEHLTALLAHMTKAMIRDGEGVTKFITIEVRGVPTEDHARRIAFSIGNSPLVKTALFGEQANWGRLLMAAGKAQTGLDFGNVDLSINGTALLSGSALLGEQALQSAAAGMKQGDVDIVLDLNQGRAEFVLWTCDFSLDYVRINADYLT